MYAHNHHSAKLIKWSAIETYMKKKDPIEGGSLKKKDAQKKNWLIEPIKGKEKSTNRMLVMSFENDSDEDREKIPLSKLSVLRRRRRINKRIKWFRRRMNRLKDLWRIKSNSPTMNIPHMYNPLFQQYSSEVWRDCDRREKSLHSAQSATHLFQSQGQGNSYRARENV